MRRSEYNAQHLRRRRAWAQRPVAAVTLIAFAWSTLCSSLVGAQTPRDVPELRESVGVAQERAANLLELDAETPSAATTDKTEQSAPTPSPRDVNLSTATDVLRPDDLATTKVPATGTLQTDPSQQPRELVTGGDKSGVSSRAISVPQGAGKLDGMGESFSAQLSTGVASYSVPINLPKARGQAQPSLSLAYSSGGGSGVVGMGWSLNVPFIARQTDRGVPKYDDRSDFHHEQDRFVFNGGQELVPICRVSSTFACSGTSVVTGALPGESMPPWSAGWQYFRPRVEGSFLRFFWSANRLTWRVQDKSGVTMEFGVALDGKSNVAPLERNPEKTTQIYAWHLARQYDTYGTANPPTGNPTPVNVVVYRYTNVGGQAYLSDIFDTTPAETPTNYADADFAHHVRLEYDTRPDPSVSYRSGWKIEQTKRVKRIDVTSKTYSEGTSAKRALVRRYHLGYDTSYHTSYLQSLQVEGRCATKETDAPREDTQFKLLDVTGCGRLPAMTFDYSHVGSSATDEGFEQIDTNVQTLSQAPGVVAKSLGASDVSVELFDVNGDALPDVVWSPPWTAFLNGPRGIAGTFASAVPMPVDTPAASVVDSAAMKALALANANVASLDYDGDGFTDLVHTPAVNDVRVYSLLKGAAAPQWVVRKITAQQDVKVDFRSGTRATRVADVNFDGLVDVVVATGEELQTFFSLGRYVGGQGRFGTATRTGINTATFSDAPITACLPWAGQSVDFDSGLIQLGDMNGDGIVDLVKLVSGKVQFWPGRGDGFWGSRSRQTLSGCQTGVEDTGYLTMASSPFYSGFRPERVRLSDVNGDGLDDIVQVDEDSISLWLNIDGRTWGKRQRLGSLPSAARDLARVRFADINGSGTPDILWGNGGDYRYLDLAGGKRAGLLTLAANGLGKTAAIEYSTSTAEMLTAEQNQVACDVKKPWSTPWCSKMPTVVHVVKRVTESDNLSVAGVVGSGTTEYSYRDPVFDGRQREFRGFRIARSRRLGDANAPTDVTESRFLLGECQDETVSAFDDSIENCADPARENPREALKGLPYLSTNYSDTGIYLSTQATRYRLRHLYTGRDGRFVRQALEAAHRNVMYDSSAGAVSSTRQEDFTTVELERGYDASKDPLKVSTMLDDPTTIPVMETSVTAQLTLPAYSQYAVIERASFVDFFGNAFLQVSKGCVSGPECPTLDTGMVPDEWIYSYTLPALPSGQETSWLYRTSQSYVKGSVHSAVKRNQRLLTYSPKGAPTTTTSVLVDAIDLDRRHAGGKNVAPTTSDAVTASATFAALELEYDTFGNVIKESTPLGRCRRIAYDELKSQQSQLKLGYSVLAVTETLFPAGCDLGTGMSSSGTYDRGFGKLDSALDLALQRTAIAYDEFGRLSAMRKPHADGSVTSDTDVPSLIVEYTLPPSPSVRYSVMRTRTADGTTETSTDYRESYSYIDGAGRTRVTLAEADTTAGDGGKWIVTGVTRLNAKGGVLLAFSPYFSNASATAFPLATTPSSKYKRQLYDAFNRPWRAYELDGTLVSQQRYHALSSDTSDAEDLTVASPHYQTHASERRDGHGRTIVTTARNKISGSVEASDIRVKFLPTGEAEVITRLQPSNVNVPAAVRWMRYDSFGHLVLNVDPNTSTNFNPDPATDSSAIKAWRYVFSRAGEMVGTSDARGCGQNYYYDGVGRLIAEDFSPCENHHRDWLPPNLTPGAGYGTGVDALYIYDAIATRPGGDIPPSYVSDAPKFLAGKLAAVYDRAQNSWFRYDGRGRTIATNKRIAVPGTAVQDPSVAYSNDWFLRELAYDAADREIIAGSGAARVSGGAFPVAGVDGASNVTTTYSGRGTVKSVAGSYGTLIQSVKRDADDKLSSVVWGDIANTTTLRTYDVRRRPATTITNRLAPALWAVPGDYTPTPIPNGPPTSFQLGLQNDKFTYDLVGNPTKIEDLRAAGEWPAGALPVTRTASYDSLYRLAQLDYSYGAGDDIWSSPHAADLGGAADPRRATPSPHVQFATRTKQQTYQYDWLGNVGKSADDQGAFYDRSLGDQVHDTSARYRLTAATGVSTSVRGGSLTAAYLTDGSMSSLVVQRSGPCLPSSSPCNARFDYQWDEVGRLQSAMRNDFVSVGSPLGTAEASLSYTYDSNDQRVIKAAAPPTGSPRYAVYVFDTYELRGATYDTAAQKYERTALTEVPYLHAKGERLAKVAHYALADNVPRRASATLHVFLQMEDGLGSTSIIVDKDTSELVERRTYFGYGAAESDYRPARWKGARADDGFTGKEEDVEVGLQYFGKRYLSPYLGRWVSPDPLALHAPGTGDLNLYAYVHGRVLQGVDPFGLDGPVMPWDVFLQKAEDSAPAIAKNSALVYGETTLRMTPVGITYSFVEGLHHLHTKVQPFLDRCIAGKCGEQDIRPLENLRDDIAVGTGAAIVGGAVLHVTAPAAPNAYQSSPSRVQSNLEAFRQKVLKATGEDLAAPRVDCVKRSLEYDAQRSGNTRPGLAAVPDEYANLKKVEGYLGGKAQSASSIGEIEGALNSSGEGSMAVVTGYTEDFKAHMFHAEVGPSGVVFWDAQAKAPADTTTHPSGGAYTSFDYVKTTD